MSDTAIVTILISFFTFLLFLSFDKNNSNKSNSDKNKSDNYNLFSSLIGTLNLTFQIPQVHNVEQPVDNVPRVVPPIQIPVNIPHAVKQMDVLPPIQIPVNIQPNIDIVQPVNAQQPAVPVNAQQPAVPVNAQQPAVPVNA
jgi:hypothetical protein